jgi:glucokinase
VVAVGTGLGVSGYVPGKAERMLLSGEGGHITFAPTDDEERAVARLLEPRFGRLSNERVLSGDGLHLLYVALCQLAGEAPRAGASRAVSDLARAGDALALRTLAFFSRALGAFSGDVALVMGAGALYLAGGMLKGMQEVFDPAAFRAGFEDKGRLADDMARIPSFHIRHPQPALLGAALMALD